MVLVDEKISAGPHDAGGNPEEHFEIGHPRERADGDIDNIETVVVFMSDVENVGADEFAIRAGGFRELTGFLDKTV